MTDSSSTEEDTPPAGRSRGHFRAWPVLAAVALLPICAWGAWQGGLAALAALVVAIGAVIVAAPRRGTAAQPAATPGLTSTNAVAAAVAAAPGGVSPMVTEVIPVWVRQLETTRSTADDGLNQVLQAFTEMNGSLDNLLSNLEGMSTSAQPGAVDKAVLDGAGPLDRLLAPSMRAFTQRQQAFGELDHCSEQLAELARLARQAKEIGRHTRLVAFNASIEASREQRGQDGGNETVAQEMRLIATRMSDNAAATQKLVIGLQQRLDATRHGSVTQETTAEELRMELDLRAREALQALMSAVGASLSTSGSVREASAALRQNLEDAFVHFQFGDRLSQMLAIVGNDMNNFVDWMTHNPGATIDDANEWLKRLEASYTMEEQRSEHHGNVHVDRGSEVEFF